MSLILIVFQILFFLAKSSRLESSRLMKITMKMSTKWNECNLRDAGARDRERTGASWRETSATRAKATLM